MPTWLWCLAVPFIGLFAFTVFVIIVEFSTGTIMAEWPKKIAGVFTQK